MRLFIAIDFDEITKSNLLKSINDIKNNSLKTNLTTKENLHLTLCFIGEYSDKYKVINIINSLNLEKNILKIKGIDCFNNNESLLIYRELLIEKVLNNYVTNLKNKLKENNIPFDPKPFKAHITLSRNTILKSDINLNDLYQEEIEYKVTSIKLYESRRINNELKYLSLYKKELV